MESKINNCVTKNYLEMKNYALLKFDQSDSFWHRFSHKQEYYKFPIVYEDGFVSYRKNVTQGHGNPWGFICKGYIISLHPTPEMLPAATKDYCGEHIFAGRPICIPPRAVMKKVLNHIFEINDMLKALGGEPFANDWYMAQNDKFGDLACRPNKDIILAVHPQMSDAWSCTCFDANTKAAFYPAVKI